MAGLEPPPLETKFTIFKPELSGEDGAIEGYASVFDVVDDNGDVIAPGAFASSLASHARRRTEGLGTSLKMLWQHDPADPIGIWTDVAEDAHGLRVHGRLVTQTRRGADAQALLRAGAIDGLSIGFRTRKAVPIEGTGRRRILELDLWEISLVTFPMLALARVAGGSRTGADADVAAVLREAARALA